MGGGGSSNATEMKSRKSCSSKTRFCSDAESEGEGARLMGEGEGGGVEVRSRKERLPRRRY